MSEISKKNGGVGGHLPYGAMDEQEGRVTNELLRLGEEEGVAVLCVRVFSTGLYFQPVLDEAI